jgi:hypothetical protein
MSADPQPIVPQEDRPSGTEPVAAPTGQHDQTSLPGRLDSRRDASPVSPRALLIGLAFVIYFAAGGPGGVGGFHLAPGSLVVLFLLAAVVNPLLRRLRRHPLRPEELIVIWTMLAVALVNDLSFYLPVTLVGPFYFASRENGWAALFHRYLPPALFPQDPRAILWFFHGLPPGQGVPWLGWGAALAPWLLFAALFYLMMFCLSGLLRAQWSERERFSFPIVQIPVEIAMSDRSGSEGLFAQRLFWLGTALPVSFHLLNGLSQHFPAIPSIPLRLPLEALLQERPWNEVQPLTLFVVFAVIGFSFLLPLEISFSFAFFFLFYKLECYIGGVCGLEMPVAPAYIARDFAQHQEIGAFLAIAGGILLAGRTHWREVWRRTLRPGEDREEPIPYRWALLGLATSLAGMGLWLWLAGVQPIMAGLCLAIFMVMTAVISWAVVGGGQFFMQNSFAPLEVMMTGLGSAGIGPGSFTMLRVTQMIFMYDMRSLQMPTLLHGCKGAEACGVRGRSMVSAMALALLVAVLVGTAVSIWYVSRQSALKLGGWGYLSAPRIPGRHIADVLRNPHGPSAAGAAWVAAGALFTSLLILSRVRFLWFPFHPIGFAFAGSYAMYTVWFSFFLGWLCKLLVTRYGGLRGFLLLRPFFLGLVLGDCLMASFWAIVGAATRVEYPPFSGIA